LLLLKVQIVAPKAQGADKARDAIEDNGACISFLSQQVATEGGGNHRGDPGDHGEHQKVAQFDNRELSSMSQVMFKKMKTTIDSFGQALSPEEKMQVLAKLLSEIM